MAKWRLRAFVFRIIRPLFVRNVNANEDYLCCHCEKPVLRRLMYCSLACSLAGEVDHLAEIVYDLGKVVRDALGERKEAGK